MDLPLAGLLVAATATAAAAEAPIAVTEPAKPAPPHASPMPVGDTRIAVTEPAKPATPSPPHASPMPAAETMPVPPPKPESREQLRPQLQIDGGLSVIGAAYEHPVARHVAVQAEVFVFGTYFLPWFDLGDRVVGVGAGLRPTWFARASGRGLYVAPYVRVVAVDDESLAGASGAAVTAGVFAGWAFGLSPKLDLRIGAGAQYIHVRADTPTGEATASTPFVALDAVLGYRL